MPIRDPDVVAEVPDCAAGAAIISLLHTARLNRLKPYAYLKDVLE